MEKKLQKTTIILPEELHDALRYIAYKDKTSISKIIINSLHVYFSRFPGLIKDKGNGKIAQGYFEQDCEE